MWSSPAAALLRESRNSQGTQRRPLRQQPENHKFGSLLMLAVTAGSCWSHGWQPRRYFSSSNHLQSFESDWQNPFLPPVAIPN